MAQEITIYNEVNEMGMFDKFMNILNINDDEDYDEYDEYDDVDEEDSYEEAPKKSFFGRKKEKDLDYEEEEKSKSTAPKITPLKSRKASSSGMEVCVIKPRTFEDAREITDTLLLGRAVVLNLEGMDVEVAQRVIDFTCGTCVAIDGNLQKISSYIFIVTPKSVDISGDMQDILSDAFEVPTIKTDF